MLIQKKIILNYIEENILNRSRWGDDLISVVDYKRLREFLEDETNEEQGGFWGRALSRTQTKLKLCQQENEELKRAFAIQSRELTELKQNPLNLS